jgi:hypothetical protein
MTAIYVISIKSVISSELLSSDTAKLFITDELSKIVVDHILVDFSQVKTMNHTFALQYLTSKQDINRKKLIKEVNIPENIYRVFQDAQIEIENSKRKNININNDYIETANTVLVPNNS